MALGYKRIAVNFSDHDTMAGFLEGEDDRGITVFVQEPSNCKGFWFFPWTNIISVFNVDSPVEIKKRDKTAAKAKTPSAKETWDIAESIVNEDGGDD